MSTDGCEALSACRIMKNQFSRPSVCMQSQLPNLALLLRSLCSDLRFAWAQKGAKHSPHAEPCKIYFFEHAIACKNLVSTNVGLRMNRFPPNFFPSFGIFFQNFRVDSKYTKPKTNWDFHFFWNFPSCACNFRFPLPDFSAQVKGLEPKISQKNS